MSASEPFDALARFAEIERLVGKIYFRFSHLFLDQPEIRDFWWEMAREEEQHGCILHACKALIANYDDETLDPAIGLDKAQELEKWLGAFLQRGAPSLSVAEAFQIALEIESSEIDTIYGKLLNLGGPNITRTMQYLGVPASVQRQKLKVALRRFCSGNPDLLRAADQLL